MPCLYLHIRFLISRSSWKIRLWIFLKFLIFKHLSHFHYLCSTIYILFEYQHCRLLSEGEGKALNKSSCQLSVMVCCQMFDKLSLGHRPSGCNEAYCSSEEPAKRVATRSNSSVSFGRISKAKVWGVVIPVLAWSCLLRFLNFLC